MVGLGGGLVYGVVSGRRVRPQAVLGRVLHAKPLFIL